MRLVAAKLIMGWWLGVKGKHLSPKRMNLLNRCALLCLSRCLYARPS